MQVSGKRKERKTLDALGLRQPSRRGSPNLESDNITSRSRSVQLRDLTEIDSLASGEATTRTPSK